MSQQLVQYSSTDSSEGAPLTDEEEDERDDETTPMSIQQSTL